MSKLKVQINVKYQSSNFKKLFVICLPQAGTLTFEIYYLHLKFGF